MSNILNSKVVIFIASEQKGFLIALADILERVHGLNTVIVARDIHVKNLVKKLLPNRKNDIVVVEKTVKHKITCIGNESGIRFAITKPDVDHVYVD